LTAGLLSSLPSWSQSSKSNNDGAKLDASVHRSTNSAGSPAEPARPVSSIPSQTPGVSTKTPNVPTKESPSGESIFDGLGGAIGPVTTSIEVHAAEETAETSSPEPMRAGGHDVIESAGTFGDISRYLQLLPGVVSTSDQSNQVLVRGGHPMENLFMVDGIEVPNINHLANANTTGGLGPMLDAAAVQGLRMYTGGFDARFPERLSSVTEFRTLDSLSGGRHLELDLGIQGVGGLAQARLLGGDALVSVHHGLLKLVSSNVGIDGVPSYTNALSRYRKDWQSGNHLTLVNLAGWDSIDIEPCASDTVETSSIDSEYRGWRETTGGEWQHVYSARSFGVWTISDSEQVEHIDQEDQIVNPLKVANPRIACPIPDGDIQTAPVYAENSNNAFSTAAYRYEWGNSQIALTAGSSFWLQRPHLQIAQPEGAFSPYLSTPTRTDTTSFDSDFSKGESGTFAQVLTHPLRDLSVGAGGRLQTFAFGSQLTLTPRLSASYRLGERATINVAYAGYAQLPPFAYLLAYPVNRTMTPMRATHAIMGASFNLIRTSMVRLEAYNKDYSVIPASTEYPAVTLHTLVDMLGEQLVWLPMRSGGSGNSSGIEVSDSTRIGSRLQFQGSAAYARAKFAGLDGVLRASNFDFPWIVNFASVGHIGRGMIVSSRYGYATGRPYTPFDMAESVAQNRPIYDLANVNVPRAPYYSRLDAQLNKAFQFHRHYLELYAGVDNILNRSNFLSYAWMPRYGVGNPKRDAVGTLYQTPIFPNFGVRFIAR
jgi:hypothetical protein